MSVNELLILLLIALPPLVIGILIWGWVREADASQRSRGFEVKLKADESAAVKEQSVE